MKIRELKQKKAIKLANLSLKKTGKALLEMATGTGKTITAINLIKSKYASKRVLWLTHRNELLDQTVKQMVKHGIKDVSVYNASKKDLNSKVIVGSIPTISRPKTFDIFKKQQFDLVIFDEAHHFGSATWEKLGGLYKKTNVLGLTATPERPDGISIEKYFGKKVMSYEFAEAVDDGIISKPHCLTVLTGITINGLKHVHKDYTPSQLDRFFTVDKRNQIVVDSYLKDAKPKIKKLKMKPKAICFCINSNHAQIMKKEFLNRGVTSEILVSNQTIQNQKERANIFKRFKETNDIEVLCVVDIFNEGVDIEDINVLLMVRPTRSSIIYQQQNGRGCRTILGKKSDYVILDFVDNMSQKFLCYTGRNTDHSKAASSRAKFIKRYVSHMDKIEVKRIILDIMKNVNEFKEYFRINYTEHSTTKLLNALETKKL